MRLIAGIKIYNDSRYLEAVLTVASQTADEVWIALNRRPWRGERWSDDGECEAILQRWTQTHPHVHLVTGTWTTEEQHINSLIAAAIVHEKSKGFDPTDGNTWYWYLDADEIYQPEDVEFVKSNILSHTPVDVVMVPMITHFKFANWIVNPPEPLQPASFFRLRPDFAIVNIRNCYPPPNGGLVLTRGVCVMNHLSYVGTDEEIQHKIGAFSHSHELVPNWFEKVWKNVTLQSTDIHPTHPQAYGGLLRLEPNTLPSVLLSYPDKLLLDTSPN